MSIRDIPQTDPFWIEMRKYLEEVWWPAIREDPIEYNYWRMTPQKRMGKFKIVKSQDQDVLEE